MSREHFLDPKWLILKKMFSMDRKYETLDGYGISGYKQFVFFYGGERLLGKGNWNFDFRSYDIIEGVWRDLKP